MHAKRDESPEDSDALDGQPFSLSEPFFKLAKDVKESSVNLSRVDARWLVDQYYILQDARIRAKSQLRACQEAGEPNRLIDWMYDSAHRFETAVKAALGVFAGSYAVGQWMQSQYGIGPVLSAAFLSEFDIRKAPTVGHFWRFAGLDPTCVWLGKANSAKLVKEILGDSATLNVVQATVISKESGRHVADVLKVFNEGYAMKNAKRKKGKAALVAWLSRCPWNQSLKSTVLFRFGETLVKFQGREDCFYGRLLAVKKAALWEENLAGKFSAQAAIDADRVGKDTGARKWKSGQYDPAVVRKFKKAEKPLTDLPTCENGTPMLPPGQIHNRARRWAVKLFLSHLHRVSYEDFYGKEPPAPFIFEHPEAGDHRHLIEPPHWHYWNGGSNYVGGKPLRELLESDVKEKGAA